MIPLVAAFLPESIDSLIARRPANALSGINRTLGRLGHAPVDAMPPPPSEVVKPSMVSLFSSRYSRITILVTIPYFAQVLFFFFLSKRLPKIDRKRVV